MTDQEKLEVAFNALFDLKDQQPVGQEAFSTLNRAILSVKEAAYVLGISLPRRFDAPRAEVTT